tara:strand:+ start:996 stop:1247 length:252 start_codon:yes stop_codon:yes gene_type:complete
MPSILKLQGSEAAITTADNISTATVVRCYNATASGILVTQKNSAAETLATVTVAPGVTFIKKAPTDTLTAASAVLMVSVAHYT